MLYDLLKCVQRELNVRGTNSYTNNLHTSEKRLIFYLYQLKPGRFVFAWTHWAFVSL